MRKIQKFLALILIVTLLCTSVVNPAFAYWADKEGSLSVAGNDGSGLTEDASWEETFPNGTFAFQDSYLLTEEGARDEKITVYRLGGTNGAATAQIAVTPAVAEQEEGGYNYNNAAGWPDFQLLVEASQPTPILDASLAGQANTLIETTTGGMYDIAELFPQTLLVQTPQNEALEIAAYWGSEAEWAAYSGSGEHTFTCQAPLGYEWADGVTPPAVTVEVADDGSEPLAVEQSTLAAAAPVYETIDGIDYYALDTTEADEYDTLFIDLVFAEGEWVKDILVRPVDDDAVEAEKFALFTIYDALGAEFTESANTLTLCIQDNEDAEESQAGFEVSSLRVDRSTGAAKLTVKRTGGLPFVFSANYETADGTALAGRDYQAANGTVAFAGGEDTAVIEIPLITQGAEEAELSFTVTLTEPRGGSLQEGAETMTVLLYHSGEQAPANFATLLSVGEDTVDLAGQAVVADKAVIETDPAVTVEAVEREDDLIPAEIGGGSTAAEGEIVPMSFDYDRISLGAKQGTWRDHTTMSCVDANHLTGRGYNYPFSDNIGNLDVHPAARNNLWSGNIRSGGLMGSGSKPIYRWGVESQDQTSAKMKIDGLYEFYDTVWYDIDYKANDRSYKAFYGWVYERMEVSLGPARLLNKRNAKGRTTQKDFLSTATDAVGLPMSTLESMLTMQDYTYAQIRNINELTIRKSHDTGGRDITGWAWLDYLAFRRLALNRNPILRIHTADDVLLNESASGQDYLKRLQPSISLVGSNGGTNASGNLYIGSQLDVKVNDTAGAYQLASPDNDIRHGIYLKDEYNNRIMAYATTAGRLALREDMAGRYGPVEPRFDYSVNVVMNRIQSITVDFSMSLPRDEEGNALTDPTSVASARNHFLNAAQNPSYTNRTVDNSDDRFSDPTKRSLSLGNMTASGNQLRLNNVQNLQSINFGLPAGDLIIYNKTSYPGNADIPIAIDSFLDSNITFLYVAEEYITAINKMAIASFDRIERYVDVDNNLVLSGVLDTGAVDPAAVDPDALMETITDELYMDTNFAPLQDSNGVYHQQLFKVRYTMIPRSLVVPEGASAEDKAEVVPAFVTAITNQAVKDRLTPEMQGYRYIASQDNQQLMYQAEATGGNLSFPLGGDYSPATYAGDNWSWSPAWHGNLRADFDGPAAIYLDNTKMYNGFAAAETPEAINNYLGSFNAEDTFSLAVVIPPQNLRRSAAEGASSTLPGTESVNTAPFATYPEPAATTRQSEQTNPMPSTNTKGNSKADDAPGELSAAPSIAWPTADIGLGPASFIMDKDSIGFSFGVPLFSAEKNKDYNNNTWGDAKTAHVGNKATDSFNKMREALSSGAGRDNVFKQLRDMQDSNKLQGFSYTNAKQPRIKPKPETGFTFSVAMNFTFMWKYSRIDNRYHFDSGMFLVSVGGEFKHTQRLTPVPIVYVYVVIGLKADMSLGVQMAENTQKWKNKNEDIIYPALDAAQFAGYDYGYGSGFANQAIKKIKVSGDGKKTVERYVPWNYSNPNAPAGYQTYADLKNGSTYNKDVLDLKLLFAEDFSGYPTSQMIDGQPRTVREQTVTFSGFTISPTFYIELGAGVGIELFKVEVYIKGSIGFSATFGKTNANAAEFNYFKTAAALGVRVQLIFFSFDFPAVQFEFGYDPSKYGGDGWYYVAYAAGQKLTRSIGPGTGGEPKVTYSLPQRASYSQQIHAPTEEADTGDISPMAISFDNIPFQLSGYSSSANAYALGTGLGRDTDYQLLTVGTGADAANYLIYNIDRGTGSSIDANMLVLSKLVLTGSGSSTSYGLVNPDPNAAADAPNYIVLDDDAAGDLEFKANVSGDTVHVAWTGYATTSVDPDTTGLSEEEAQAALKAAMAEARENVIVKYASYTAGGAAFSTPVVASALPEDGEYNANYYRYLPRTTADGRVIFHGEAVPYANLAARDAAYAEFYGETEQTETMVGGTTVYSTAGDPHASYKKEFASNMNAFYGDHSLLHFQQPDGTAYENAQLDLGAGVKLDRLELIMTSADELVLAYSTMQTELLDMDEDPATHEDEVTVKKLYLRRGQVSGDNIAWEAPKLVQKLADFLQDDTQDGVYDSAGNLVLDDEGNNFINPFFGNLQFVRADLGNGLENLFLFAMNNTTYVIDSASLGSILGVSGSFRTLSDTEPLANFTIQPLFEAGLTSDGDSRGDVTMGVDGEGNLNVVYTQTMPQTGNNALFCNQYDKSIGAWGEGRLLAMHHLQTYEKAQAESWDAEVLEQAYLEGWDGAQEKDYGMDKLIFAEPQIALGQAGDGAQQRGTLLLVSRTLLTQLIRQARYTDDGSGNIVNTGESIVVPATGATPEAGLFALSFGAGEQAVGDARLSFLAQDFVPGAQLEPLISFKNVGNTAIRGSAANPISITLMLSDQGGSGGQELAEWRVTTNILAGASVNTMTDCLDEEGEIQVVYAEPLPNDLAGRTLYFSVMEDSYFTDPYAWNSLATDNETGKWELSARPELRYEHLKVSAEGHTTLNNTLLRAFSADDSIDVQVDLQVGNRGTATANQVRLLVEYAEVSYDATTGERTETWRPADISNNTLTVSDQEPLLRALAAGSDLSNGLFLLQGSDGANIEAHHGRTVTGTITLPKRYYSAYAADDDTPCMNLRFTILSDGAAVAAELDEYNTDNNLARRDLLATSLFQNVPAQIYLLPAVSTQLVIPVNTTLVAQPTVTVTEVVVREEDKLLNTLSYDLANNLLTIVPKSGASGSGIIRLADTSTASFTDFTFTITDSAGLNIFNDIASFEFRPQASWEFRANMLAAACTCGSPAGPHSASCAYLPAMLRNDASIGAKGATLSFKTSADSITLHHFKGSIQVSSVNTFGYVGGSYSNADFGDLVIPFGNDEAKTHEVTFTVTSTQAWFDSYTEGYGGSLPEDAKDIAKPLILLGKSAPAARSLQSGTEFLMPIYALDDLELSSFTVNNRAVGSYSADKRSAEHLLSITENGVYTLVAMDTSGKTTVYTLTIDWFSGDSSNTDTAWPQPTAVLKDSADAATAQEITTVATAGWLHLSAGATLEYLADHAAPLWQPLVLDEGVSGQLTVENNGFYRVRLEQEGRVTEKIIYVDLLTAPLPVELKLPTGATGAGTLFYSIGSLDWNAELSRAMLYSSNEIILEEPTSGGIPITVSGRMVSGTVNPRSGNVFALFAEDANGIRGNALYTSITPVPVSFSATSTDSISQDKKAGTGTVTFTAEGGFGSYLYSIDGGQTWVENELLEHVLPGDYSLLVKDRTHGSFTGDNAAEINATLITTPQALTIHDYAVDFRVSSQRVSGLWNATVTVTNGPPEAEYEYCVMLPATPDNPNPEDVWQADPTFTGLATGTYTFKARVTDAVENLCIKEQRLATSPPNNGGGDGGGGGGDKPDGPDIPDTDPPLTDPPFTDVPESHWAYDFIAYMAEHGYIKGKTALLFAPEDNITRAEFVTILARMSGETLPTSYSGPFTDVVRGSYYEGAVAWGVQAGIVKGTSLSTFSPNNLILRQEIATMIVRYASYKQFTLPQTNAAASFTDADDIHAYAREAVTAMQRADIINGYEDGSFRPLNHASRAEAAKMLALLQGMLTGK